MHLQVADANSTVRQRLCLKYFTLLKQLADKDVNASVLAELQQQLDHVVMQTQSRSAILLLHLSQLQKAIHRSKSIRDLSHSTQLVMQIHGSSVLAPSMTAACLAASHSIPMMITFLSLSQQKATKSCRSQLVQCDSLLFMCLQCWHGQSMSELGSHTP